MGRDGDRLDGDRDHPARLDLDILVAGRDPEFVARCVVPVHRLLDRLAREVKADACPVALGLAIGVIVNLDNDVGLGRDADSDAIGESMGFESGGPEAQFVGFKPRARRCRVARAGRICVELAPPSHGIDVGDEMVHRASCGGRIVDRFDVTVFRQISGQNEAAVDIGPRGGYREIFGRLEDQVGGPELPTLGKRARGRQILGIASRGPRLGPGGEDADLPGRERLVVLELRANPTGRLPGRHRPLFRHEGNVMRSLAGLLISLQRERPDLVAAMAALTLRLEDSSDVFRVSWTTTLGYLPRLLARTRFFVTRGLVWSGLLLPGRWLLAERHWPQGTRPNRPQPASERRPVRRDHVCSRRS